MIIRGLAGILIGVAYGFLVSVVVFLLTRIDLDETHSSATFGDPVALAWFATVISGLIAGVCAALVGLVVGIAGLGRSKGALIGFLTGLLALGLLSINSWSAPLPTSLHDWIALFVAITILPIGVAVIGMVVAIVADRLSTIRSIN
jgi:hypothetical protein